MDSKRTCYSYGGIEYGNNTKCPDSDSCCQTAEQCRPDRLCNTNSDSQIIVRALCANYPWTLSTCAQICLYDNPTYYLPRVNICPDGSYCCDNDPTCCVDKQGFFLNGDGVVTARANETTTTPYTSTMTSFSSSTSAGTIRTTHSILSSGVLPSTNSLGIAQASSTSNAAVQQAESGLSRAAKVGLGVGISLGVLILACLGILLWLVRRQRKKHQDQGFSGRIQLATKPKTTESKPTEPAELSTCSRQLPAMELAADDDTKLRRHR